MRRRYVGLCVVVLFPACLAAQTGLLVVAHGAGPAWNDGVRSLVAQLQWSGGPVATAFLMGPEAETAGWDSAVARLVREGTRSIVAVPLMVSSYGGHYHQVRYLAGEVRELPAELAEHHHHAGTSVVPIRVTAALDDAPELGAALEARWLALDATDRRRALVLIAHGPTTDEEAALWASNLSRAAAAIRAEAPTTIAIGLLRDDAPPPIRSAAVEEIRRTVHRIATETADSVTVMPVLISSGQLDQVRIPTDLAGLPIRYVPVSLTPLSVLARWIERVAREKAATTP